MALKILYAGHRNTQFSLEADGFTKANFPTGMKNDTLNATFPQGVLAGSVAALKGDLVCGAATRSTRAMGLFINNAAGNPYENTPAIASEKAPFVSCLSTVNVDVYETYDSDGAGNALHYGWGDLLYASANGLLTKESSQGQAVIGYVVKAPSAADPWLGVQLLV